VHSWRVNVVGEPKTAGSHLPEEVVGEGYRILGVLGTGGIATTYLAEDAHGRKVALKQLYLWRRHDWKVFELFEREAKVLAQLAHPGIPRFIDFFQADTPEGRCFYLAQELVTGRTLKAWVDSGWHPTEPFVRDVAGQLLGILEYLHGLRPPVIHRDIKPANVIWRGDGTLALVDFGSVRETDRERDDGSTIVGTFGFMAPEQFRGHAVLAGKALAILKGNGPTKEVEQLVDAAMKASSRNAPAFYALGLLEKAQGNPLRAKLSFKMALTIDPKHAGAKAELGSE